jgi:C_GCAxxG_C_C family probable redox protein
MDRRGAVNRRDFLRTSTAGLAAAGLFIGGDEAHPIEGSEARGQLKSPEAEVFANAVHRHFIPGKKTCSEAMLLGCCETLGIESPLVPDIALGMGGGVGLQGHICGIVTGGTMVTGLVVGSREADYTKKKMRVLAASARFLQIFQQEYRTLSCRKICGLDLTTPEGRAELEAGVKAEKCAPVIQACARRLAEILREDEEHPSYDIPRALSPEFSGPRGPRRGRRGI